MSTQTTIEQIKTGQAVLGIEFGSTRIKAVLVDSTGTPIAAGIHDWENQNVDGIWTYSLDMILKGLQGCYASLCADVHKQYGLVIKKLQAIGISGMMHGYMPFDKQGTLLSPFRTWRNNITEKESIFLTELLNYPIPQRWTIAHLCQEVDKKAEYLTKVDYVCTLAGYIHWQLTDEKLVGVGEASGMFPVDIHTRDYDEQMLSHFDEHAAKKGYSWKLKNIFPKVKNAGEQAGVLTAKGVKLLDASGNLESGIPFCPPEGDAGTGMVATNSITPRTGNVSAGTSVFAMIVLEKELSKVHSQLDLVTTPDGSLVAMAHSNNCTTEYDNWIQLFKEVITTTGGTIATSKLYDDLLSAALKGDPDCGGLLAYGYISGEHMTGFSEGRPLVVRHPDAKFTLANFMRAQLFTSLCAMRIGLDILFEQEGVKLDVLNGHGGFFKTAKVGQAVMAAAAKTPVAVLASSGEGGAWGIALLASFLSKSKHSSLSDYLNKEIFSKGNSDIVKPQPEDIKGFDTFLKRYKAGLPIEREAVNCLNSSSR